MFNLRSFRNPVIGEAQPYLISSHGRPRADQSEDARHPSPPTRDRLAAQRGRGVQMLLGNHHPDDILDLKCNICTETTYGSVHAFRKHFFKVGIEFRKIFDLDLIDWLL